VSGLPATNEYHTPNFCGKGGLHVVFYAAFLHWSVLLYALPNRRLQGYLAEVQQLRRSYSLRACNLLYSRRVNLDSDSDVSASLYLLWTIGLENEMQALCCPPRVQLQW